MNPALPAPLIARLFSAGVAAAELREDADASLLFPAESAFCAGFAPSRVAEFTAGRLCARRALAEFGVIDAPIIMNPDRSPRWPAGFCGSISHTLGYRCAVVAPQDVFDSLGLDVEIVGRVDAEIDTLVFTAQETAFLAGLEGAAHDRAATIVFSAKEALYKCQYTLTRKWLDFQDVTVQLALEDGSAFAAQRAAGVDRGLFRVRASDGQPATDNHRVMPDLWGRFSIDGTIVATGVGMQRAPETSCLRG